MNAIEYIKETVFGISPQKTDTEKAIKKLEETKDYLKHLIVHERKKMDDANIVALQAVSQTQNFLKLKKFNRIYEYWTPTGIFESVLTSYDVAIVSHYRRLFDAVEAFIQTPEFVKKISAPFKKRISNDIELMRKEWAEYLKLIDLVNADSRKYFLEAMSPAATTNCIKIFMQKNKKRLERIGLLIDRQRTRFATLIADAEALLHFLKETSP